MCPKCGQPTLHKVYAPVGIVFKGSGFYSTDNRSPSGQLPIHHENSTEKTGDSESSEHKSEPDGGEKKETPKQKSESSKASVEKSEPSKTEPKT